MTRVRKSLQRKAFLLQSAPISVKSTITPYRNPLTENRELKARLNDPKVVDFGAYSGGHTDRSLPVGVTEKNLLNDARCN
ncbi:MULTISPECIES: hypothetical protein [Polaromonas]|uniref:Uncharacterized protein n=1 Tax=Polaromonas aquatica TaxID=332657 RepID=A0ABW1TUR2_9BURK